MNAGPAFGRVVEALRAHGSKVTTRNGETIAQCPAHEDGNPSLSVTDNNGMVLLHCFAECTFNSIITALNLTPDDLRDEPRAAPVTEWMPGGVEHVSTYDYTDANGNLVFQVLRGRDAEGGKQFLQRHPDSTSRSGWCWKLAACLGDRRHLPYRLPELVDGVRRGVPVWIAEGEKDVDALRQLGVVATCNAGGAGKWRPEHAAWLKGAHVVIVRDLDEPGLQHQQVVARTLAGVAASVRLVEPAKGKDAYDHIAAGLTLAEFAPVVTDAAPEDAPTASGDAPTASGSTWARVDLRDTIAGLVAGTLHRAAPTVAPVRGGTALFYRGKVNGLAGESGAGKTWTLLHAAAGILDDGGHVLYIDHEDDAAGIVGRLLDLGVDPDAVRARFAYFNPSEKPTAGDMQALAGLVAELRPVLVVVDSTGEGLALEGANPNADEEVAAWFLRVPRRLALVPYDDQPGPAVVVLDHVVKSDDGGLWPIGSQRKRAAISGAQYMQRTVKPFDKDTAGHAVLVCAKDRHGNYRTGQRVAELHVAPGPVITLDAVEDAERLNGFRPTGYMERVSRALEDAGPLGLNGVRRAVSGKRDHVTNALGVLVAEGFVTKAPGPRGAVLHTSVRPFREADDCAPDEVPETEPETTVDRAPFLREGNGAQSLTVPPGTVGHGGARCRLHPSNPMPNACYTCAENAGRGWAS